MSFILVSCNTTEPPPDNGKPKPTLSLSLDDTSPTEVWLNLTTTDLELPNEIILFRDGDTSQIITLTESEITLYEDSLLPSRTYTYQVSSNQNQAPHMVTSSNEVSAVTMDTTSHNFTWEVFEFGEHGNSILRDVAIIDENNIWAVGAIYLKDSTGANDSKAYGVVHWNGENWTPKKLFYNNNSIISSIRGILILESNDIYLAAGSIFHWNGVSSNAELVYSRQNLSHPDGTLEKVWGDASSIYAVGNKGSIAHYNGTSWRKIESGTDVDLRDVTGNQNGTEIYISGYSTDYSKSVLMKLSNNVLNVIWENKTLQDTPPYGSTVNSIKLLNNDLFIASNIGVFRKKLKYTLPDKKLYYPPRWVYKVTGTNVNDTYSVGDRLSITHFNGSSERQVFIDYSQVSPLYSADSKENIIVAVGTKVENVLYHKAIIIKLKR
ncbi:MAG: hypothetical protein M5R37_09610 [Melioribacteraceae bacterium]|nr:hypothetical protein [Melioribacteraceae bacterium]